MENADKSLEIGKEPIAETKVSTIPEVKTDTYTEDEEKDIVRMVMEDAELDILARKGWEDQKIMDLKQYNGAKPSELEGLTKEEWQSDRNLNLCAGICDTFQSTILSTVWNPETLTFKPTEADDVDNSDNLTRFAKWAVDSQECNVFPEVDDFIHNRVTVGFSIFKIYWKVWYEWVDRRIPTKAGDRFSYKIKTQFVRFEKGVMENIANIDDILMPHYKSKLQDLPHIIHIIHKNALDIKKLGKRKVFKQLDDATLTTLKSACYEYQLGKMGKEKLAELGITDATSIKDTDLNNYPIDIYEWYGDFTKGGKTERYRFHVIPSIKVFLSGKPLRKIRRDGKFPFAGGPLIRTPGCIVGKSLVSLIAPIINAINNVYNQKSDFQYFENCPGGWYKPDENFQRDAIVKKPGSYEPTDDPSQIVESGRGRSMAWAYQDIQFLMECLERVTGAASYFMSNNSQAGTATRDQLISEKSETRFGLWVKRIMVDIEDAITMLIQLYQDNAPEGLGDRVLGKEGKKIFPNLSIETLRGSYGSRLSPDVISGSKVMERQIALWAYENLSQSVWFNPQLNPRGSWKLAADTWKIMGKINVEEYMPEMPAADPGGNEEAESEFNRMKQGEVIDPSPNENVVEHYQAHKKQKMERYHELDEEYLINFDDHLFKTQVLLFEYIQKRRMEEQANQMALRMVQAIKGGANGQKTIAGQGLPAGSGGQPGMGANMPMGAGTSGIPSDPSQPEGAPM